MKIFQFTEDVVALVAGDPSDQIMLCDKVQRVMQERKLKNKAIDTVEGIAKLFGEAFTAHRRERAENKYLKPLGLDVNEFIARQQDMRSDFVAGLVNDLQRHSLDCETIIAGKDSTGYHIFSIAEPGDVFCADAIAFASIGTGKHHADSQFMMSRHTKQTLFHTALLDIYSAKKRAEVAPTVGWATDLFYIGTDGFRLMPDDIANSIHQIWIRLESRNDESQMQAIREAQDCVAGHLAAQDKKKNEESSMPEQVDPVQNPVQRTRRKPKGS